MNILRQHWKLILSEGILLMLLGIAAMAIPQIFTLSIELFIGAILFMTGVIQIYRAIKAHRSKGFGFTLAGGIISAIVGLLMLFYPLTGIITLTILLTGYFMIEGIIKMAFSLEWKPHSNWLWLFVSGLLSLLIAIIIISGWPATAAWAIGLLVGINMLFFGWTLVTLALSIKE